MSVPLAVWSLWIHVCAYAIGHRKGEKEAESWGLRQAVTATTCTCGQVCAVYRCVGMRRSVGLKDRGRKQGLVTKSRNPRSGEGHYHTNWCPGSLKDLIQIQKYVSRSIANICPVSGSLSGKVWLPG